MRQRIFLLLSILLPAGFACGGSGSNPTGGAGGAVTTSSSGMMSTSSGTTGTTSSGTMTGGIPDPGTGDGVDNDFTDKEPNDTPQQATPLGVAMSGSVNVWVTSNTIGGADTSDYFVFKSGPAAGMFTFDICFSAPTTGMTATLWTVVGGMEQMPPVGTWSSTGTCVTDMTTPAALVASTDYLFGLTATGGSSMYSA